MVNIFKINIKTFNIIKLIFLNVILFIGLFTSLFLFHKLQYLLYNKLNWFLNIKGKNNGTITPSMVKEILTNPIYVKSSNLTHQYFELNDIIFNFHF